MSLKVRSACSGELVTRNQGCKQEGLLQLLEAWCPCPGEKVVPRPGGWQWERGKCFSTLRPRSCIYLPSFRTQLLGILNFIFNLSTSCQCAFCPCHSTEAVLRSQSPLPSGNRRARFYPVSWTLLHGRPLATSFPSNSLLPQLLGRDSHVAFLSICSSFSAFFPWISTQLLNLNAQFISLHDGRHIRWWSYKITTERKNSFCLITVVMCLCWCWCKQTYGVASRIQVWQLQWQAAPHRCV